MAHQQSRDAKQQITLTADDGETITFEVPKSWSEATTLAFLSIVDSLSRVLHDTPVDLGERDGVHLEMNKLAREIAGTVGFLAALAQLTPRKPEGPGIEILITSTDWLSRCMTRLALKVEQLERSILPHLDRLRGISKGVVKSGETAASSYHELAMELGQSVVHQFELAAYGPSVNLTNSEQRKLSMASWAQVWGAVKPRLKSCKNSNTVELMAGLNLEASALATLGDKNNRPGNGKPPAKKKRGGQTIYDHRADLRIYQRWKQRGGKIADYANELGMPEIDVKRAIDRARPR